MRAGHRGLQVRVVADGHLPDAWFAPAATSVEGLDEFRLGLGGDDEVRESAGQGTGPLAGYGHPDRGRFVRQVPQPGVRHLEVRAPVMHVAEERVDDLHGLFEHLKTDLRGGPTTAHHMLVEVLARAEPSRNRPSESTCRVAAFATTAGW